MSECEAERRLHDFAGGSMACLTCDLDTGDHAGLSHHDPVCGIWWASCSLEDHGHAAPDNEGQRARRESDAEAWGGMGPSASYAEWLAEGRDEVPGRGAAETGPS